MVKRYRYPFPESVEINIALQEGVLAHQNFPQSYYATDFLVPIGTPIFAVAPGTVISTKEDSDEWGADLSFASKANLVVIRMGIGLYAEYIHFGKDQINVKVGDQVREGDLLGYAGMSGCTTEPHLHFNVFESGIDPQSIPVIFKPRLPRSSRSIVERLARAATLFIEDAWLENRCPCCGGLFRKNGFGGFIICFEDNAKMPSEDIDICLECLIDTSRLRNGKLKDGLRRRGYQPFEINKILLVIIDYLGGKTQCGIWAQPDTE